MWRAALCHCADNAAALPLRLLLQPTASWFARGMSSQVASEAASGAAKEEPGSGQGPPQVVSVVSIAAAAECPLLYVLCL